MTNSQLFKQAHKITKAVIQANDDYRVTFGACLKMLKEKVVKVIKVAAKVLFAKDGYIVKSSEGVFNAIVNEVSYSTLYQVIDTTDNEMIYASNYADCKDFVIAATS